jgi:signal transduction histidine kinase
MTAPLPACLTESRSTQFLVELAHDLRSPLAAILMLAESLQGGRCGPVTLSQRRQLALIHASALRLCATTSDTIELARTTAGPGGPVDPLSLRDILADVRAMVLPMAETRALEVRIDLQGDDRRLGHERAIRRVLLNLATNALKATETGEVRLQAWSGSGMDVRFAVTDTGPGMDAPALLSLWEPFRPSAPGQREIFSSAGLGLAICRKLVSEMDSELQVESTPGVGSCFHFTIVLPRDPKFP